MIETNLKTCDLITEHWTLWRDDDSCQKSWTNWKWGHIL